MYAIEAKKITKVFDSYRRKFRALDGIDLRVKEGEIFGLLGPNGAGKTTLINILSTLLLPTSGSAKLMGFDVVSEPQEVRNRIGVCFGASRFYWNLNARENLTYYGMLNGMGSTERKKRIDELVEALDMKRFEKVQFSMLSTGMRQKIAIAKALINDPMVLFLDEPTIGLDVDVARSMRRFLRSRSKERGMTILLTSHNMQEVEVMCRDVALISKGRIIRRGSIEDIKRRVGFPDRLVLSLGGHRNLDFLKCVCGVRKVKATESGAVILVDSAKDSIERILAELKRRRIKVLDLEAKKASLEDVFVKIVGDVNV